MQNFLSLTLVVTSHYNLNSLLASHMFSEASPAVPMVRSHKVSSFSLFFPCSGLFCWAGLLAPADTCCTPYNFCQVPLRPPSAFVSY